MGSGKLSPYIRCLFSQTDLFIFINDEENKRNYCINNSLLLMQCFMLKTEETDS